MRRFFVGMALFLAPMTQGACTVVQASSLGKIPWQVDADTAIFLDVDDTLICYPSHLGNELWFVEQWQKGDIEEFHRLAGLLALHLPTVPVEVEGPSCVHQWQALGAEIVAITSRNTTHPTVPNWREVTLGQIQSAGYSLADQQLQIVARTPKGEVIAHWLSQHPNPPKRLLFVDDRLSDVEKVEELLGSQIDLMAVWYRACEPRRMTYDSDAARLELRALEDAQLFAGGPVVDQRQ